MSVAQRLAVAHLPAETPEERQAFETVVHSFAPMVRTAPPMNAASWGPMAMPENVRARLGGSLSDGDWSALPDDARYALWRLARLRKPTPRFEELARTVFPRISPSRDASPPTLFAP